MFALVMIVVMVAHLLVPDKSFSDSERRNLSLFPGITYNSIMNTDWLGDFESYLLDQFPARDTAVTIKSFVQFNLFGQRDNKGFYLYDGGIYNSLYPMDKQSVEGFASKLNNLYDTYLGGMNVMCAIVPDRNQYAADESGHLSFDYSAMSSILSSSLKNIRYIDLLDKLEKSCYYNTDLHWKQETLLPIAKFLASQFGANLPETEYTSNFYNDFRGGYYSRASYYLEAETLTYLTSKYTESAYVDDFQHPDFHSVYNVAKLEGVDSYDVYLSGATPLIKITNSQNTSGRKLIIFRDSFGSSIAPLLLPGYSEITLIDIRYMSSTLLSEMVQFDDQDVLFLYGTEVVNSSAILK